MNPVPSAATAFMPRHSHLVRFAWVALVALVSGCEGPQSISQRVLGEWVGRPETIAERTLREWPGRLIDDAIDAENPDVAAAIAKAPRTDLELDAPDARVTLDLRERGAVRMAMTGQEPIEGRWSLTPVVGRRGLLEIQATTAAVEDADADEARRRVYEIEMLREGDGFVLREQGADRRYGRLLFERAGGAAAPASN